MIEKYLHLFEIDSEFKTLLEFAQYIKSAEPNCNLSLTTICKQILETKSTNNKLKNLSEKIGIPPESLNFWVKKKVGDEKLSIFINGAKASEHNKKLDLVEEFKKVVQEIKPPFKLTKRELLYDDELALKATISDAHVGLDVSDGLFNYEYTPQIFTKQINEVFIPTVLNNVNLFKAKKVVISDLGDMADGWDGYTTRGGHKLPQNATEMEVFSTILKAKIQIILALVDNGVRDLTLQSVGNDNHAGKFARLINEAILVYAQAINLPCKIDNLNKFLEHRKYGNHSFLITHGKDDKEMKNGFPMELNNKVEAWVARYITHHNIKEHYIHLEKGDLHQIGFKKSQLFDYRNFGSFAPPSKWVQHQLFAGDCYSSFSVQAIHKYDPTIYHSDYFLNYLSSVDKKKML